MTPCDIGWVAGIIEGEGCIRPVGARQVQLVVQMTDEDIIRRLQDTTGCGVVAGPYDQRDGTKACWKWGVYRRQDVARVLLAIYPLLGARRQAKVAESVGHMTRPDRRRKVA